MKIDEPIISVITVIYNAVNSIEETIRSVIMLANNQGDAKIEYIVIDGGSTDGTMDVILRFKSQINYYVSEADNGIYHAMNKGIAKAKGQFVYFINAGDIAYEFPIVEILNHNADLICFPVKLSNDKFFYPQIDNALKIKNTLPHQGCFYKNTKNLKYNTAYKVYSDFALNQTYYQNNKRIIVMKQPIVAFHDIGGISHNKKYSNEIFEVIYDHFGWISVIRSFFHFKLNGMKNRFQK